MTMCSCGNRQPHPIANRRTADDRPVVIWSDGHVTAPLGLYLPGIGRRRLPQRALWAFAAEVCIFDAAELAGLFLEHQRAEMRPDALVGRRPLLYPPA